MGCLLFGTCNSECMRVHITPDAKHLCLGMQMWGKPDPRISNRGNQVARNFTEASVITSNSHANHEPHLGPFKTSILILPFTPRLDLTSPLNIALAALIILLFPR